MAKTMRGAEDPTPEEEAAENAADTQASQEPEVVTFEYVGVPPYYREFLTSHTIEKSSAKLGAPTERKSFAGRGIEVPKDLVWHRDTGWVVDVPVDQIDLIEALKGEPYLKVREAE